MRHAKVFVDLATKSCVISDTRTQHGAWAPGITRRTAETAIAQAGWMFAPDSEWTLTVDGGVRDVIQSPVLLDDRFLDDIGSAIPGQSAALADDDLAALLLTWRREIEARPISEGDGPGNRDFGAVMEHTARSAIAAARAISATVAADYDPHAQAAAELRLADAELDALIGGA